MSPHPIVQLANRALSRDENGKVVLDPTGALLLEAMILEHAHDPALPDALRDLFGMIVMLEGELASPQAAFDLAIVLGKVQPSLRHLAPDLEKILQQTDELAVARKADVEKLSGPPPEGSVSVRSLNIPPLYRPTRVPKR
jgi:hypothetical protein